MQRQSEPMVLIPRQMREGLLSTLSDIYGGEVSEAGNDFLVDRRVVATRVSATEIDLVEYHRGEGFLGFTKVAHVRKNIPDMQPTQLHPAGEARLTGFLRTLHGGVFRTGNRFRDAQGHVVAELISAERVRIFSLRRQEREIRKLPDTRPKPINSQPRKRFTSRYLHLAPAWGLEPGNYDEDVIKAATWFLRLGRPERAYGCIQFDRGARARETISPPVVSQPIPIQPTVSPPHKKESSGQPLIWAAHRFVWRGVTFSDADKLAYMKEAGMINMPIMIAALRNVVREEKYFEDLARTNEDINEAKSTPVADDSRLPGRRVAWKQRRKKLEDTGKPAYWKSSLRRDAVTVDVQSALDEAAKAKLEAEKQSAVEAERQRFRTKFGLGESETLVEKELRFAPYVGLSCQTEVLFEGRTRRLKVYNFSFAADQTPTNNFSELDQRLASDVAAKSGGVVRANTRNEHRSLFVLVNGDTVSVATYKIS